MIKTEQEVSDLFNHMADEYDDLSDLWYSWLFIRLHYFISIDIQTEKNISQCLDVGCGTGFQSFLFSNLGINTIGIDISDGLLTEARKKLKSNKTEILDSKFKFISKYRIETIKLINLFNPSHIPGGLNFINCNAINLPFENEKFDCINCIGSVISFIDNYKKSLLEIHRTLKFNGVCFLEYENRYNFDLLWSILDNILPFKLGFDINLKPSLQNFFRKPSEHIKVNYSFSMKDREIDMKIWLFRNNTLFKELDEIGFDIEIVRSIHSITNLFPSTILDDSNPSRFKCIFFKILSQIESKLCTFFPFKYFGCSTYLKLRKRLVI